MALHKAITTNHNEPFYRETFGVSEYIKEGKTYYLHPEVARELYLAYYYFLKVSPGHPLLGEIHDGARVYKTLVMSEDANEVDIFELRGKRNSYSREKDMLEKVTSTTTLPRIRLFDHLIDRYGVGIEHTYYHATSRRKRLNEVRFHHKDLRPVFEALGIHTGELSDTFRFFNYFSSNREIKDSIGFITYSIEKRTTYFGLRRFFYNLGVFGLENGDPEGSFSYTTKYMGGNFDAKPNTFTRRYQLMDLGNICFSLENYLIHWEQLLTNFKETDAAIPVNEEVETFLARTLSNEDQLNLDVYSAKQLTFTTTQNENLPYRSRRQSHSIYYQRQLSGLAWLKFLENKGYFFGEGRLDGTALVTKTEPVNVLRKPTLLLAQ